MEGCIGCRDGVATTVPVFASKIRATTLYIGYIAFTRSDAFQQEDAVARMRKEVVQPVLAKSGVL
jgi:hypothetical protein